MRISLCGFMASGKTSTGRILADSSGIPFFDLDAIIEREYDLSINDIFDLYGEEAFRIAERDKMLEILETENDFVLSTGGGAPCFFDNLFHLKAKSTCIYLKAGADTLFHRLRKLTDRPLVRNLNEQELMHKIKDLVEQREKYYMQAHYVIQTDNMLPGQVAMEIKRIVGI